MWRGRGARGKRGRDGTGGRGGEERGKGDIRDERNTRGQYVKNVKRESRVLGKIIARTDQEHPGTW